jgi:predicted Rossmann fold nucleotide-binding protein DprA/Smf involved in DNA uptake
MLRVKQNVPYINLCYVSAYNPDKFSKLRQQELQEKFEIIYLPEFESSYPKFAITRRNKYIAQNADTIICYIKNNTGGAYQATSLAKKQEKELINLASLSN